MPFLPPSQQRQSTEGIIQISLEMISSRIDSSTSSLHLSATLILNGMLSSEAQWMNDVYFAPWCRAGPYFVGVLLGFVLFRVNGRLTMHPVCASHFYFNTETNF